MTEPVCERSYCGRKIFDTLLISGPDAFFWVGPEGTPSNVPDETKTKILAHPYVEPGYYEYRDQSAPILKGAAKEQITLRLPENMKVGDIKWLSVWCRKFSVDFGNLIFPTDLNVRRDALTLTDSLIILVLLIMSPFLALFFY